MKYVLFGTHGVGKTTFLNKQKEKGFKIWAEGTREFIDELDTNDVQTISTQRKIYEKKRAQTVDFLNANDEKAIIDRTHLDSLVYSKVLFDLDDIWIQVKEELNNLFGKHKESLIFVYFPLNEENQKWIENDKNRLAFEKSDKWSGIAYGSVRYQVDWNMQHNIVKLIKEGGFKVVTADYFEEPELFNDFSC